MRVQVQQEFLRSISDKRVRVIYAPHEGVSSARNRGLREAGGKWVTFVDSDDCVESETLKRIAENTDSFCGDVEIFNGGRDADGVITPNAVFLKEDYNYASREEDKLFVMEAALSAGILPEGKKQFFSLGAPYCKLFNREFLLNNKLFFNESVKFAEDVLCLLAVYQEASSVYFHNWFFYHYGSNTQSVTRKFRPGMSQDVDVFFRELQAFLKENALDEKLERIFYFRAQFELARCFNLEFFNPQNKDPDAGKKYRKFCRSEPYKTAMKRNYMPVRKIKRRIFYKCVQYGFGNTVKTVRAIRGRLKQKKG